MGAAASIRLWAVQNEAIGGSKTIEQVFWHPRPKSRTCRVQEVKNIIYNCRCHEVQWASAGDSEQQVGGL